MSEDEVVTHKAGIVSPSFTQEDYEALIAMIRKNKEGSILALIGTGLHYYLKSKESAFTGLLILEPQLIAIYHT